MPPLPSVPQPPSPNLHPPSPGEEICPHLALREDDRTCMDYPSHWNLCHHCRPAAIVRLSHQRSMCLRPAHTECPVYQCQEERPLPGWLRARPASMGVPYPKVR